MLIATPATVPLRSHEGIHGEFLENTPLGRDGETADVTGLAVYLASEAVGFTTGETVYADGGQSLMRYPLLIDRRGQGR